MPLLLTLTIGRNVAWFWDTTLLLKIKKIPSAHFWAEVFFCRKPPIACGFDSSFLYHFFGTHTFPCWFLFWGKEKSTSNEKSLLALLTCRLLIFYRYGITACICHPKKPSNITLKRVQTLHYTIPISTLLSAKWNRLQRYIGSAWGAMQARVWDPFRAACPPAVLAILTQTRSISQLTSLSLMQKLHKSGRRKSNNCLLFRWNMV